ERREVKSEEDGDPYDVDEMPVERPNMDMRETAAFEIAQFRPPGQRQQHQNAHNDMRHVEAGDHEIERRIRRGRHIKWPAAPLQQLDSQKNDAQYGARSQPHNQAPLPVVL